MPIEIYEKSPLPVAELVGDGRSVRRLWGIEGSDNQDDVAAAILAAIPTSIAGLPIQGLPLRWLGPEHWEAEAIYSNQKRSGTAARPAVNTPIERIRIGGARQQIYRSLSTVASYALPGQTPGDYGGQINVTDDGVEGVEIASTAYAFDISTVLPAATVTQTYKAVVALLAGTVNNATFNSWAAGEVLFLGADIQRREDQDYDAVFSFERSPNETNIEVGDIVVPSKEGWDYLWWRRGSVFVDSETPLARRPTEVFIERVYRRGNLSLLGV